MFRSYTWPSSGDVPCTMLLSALLLRHNFTWVCGRIFYLCCCHVLQCCWSWSGRPARPRPTALLRPRSNGKPEAAAAVDKLLMMGMRIPETCWAVFKRQTKLRNFCIWLVDSFESFEVSANVQQSTRRNTSEDLRLMKVSYLKLTSKICNNAQQGLTSCSVPNFIRSSSSGSVARQRESISQFKAV